MWSLNDGTNDLSKKQKQIMDVEERLGFAEGEGDGGALTGSLGLVGADWHI